ncbi:MAG: hypothetical protein KAK04_12080, partial [Cyclobacteriaceae bacterium]|nr:hypothetical protein [Cyclobacteriaceae bacterium]
MRRKNKKKDNTQNTKQEQRARFNTYKRRIINYLKLIDCEEVARLIDDASFHAMYVTRHVSLPKIKMAKDMIVDRETKNDIYAKFEFMFSNKTIKINDRLTVSPKEVMSYFIMIDCMVKSKKDSSDIGEILIVEKYSEKIWDFETLFDQAFNAITSIIQTIGIVMTRMNSSLYWLEYLAKEEGSIDKRNIVEVNEYIPKKHMVMIDHHPRPVYPLCLAFADQGPVEISIPAEKIKLPGSFDKKQIPVYVQNHLFHRLEERLDCIPLFISEFCFYFSLKNPKFIYFRGKLFAEYIMDSTIKLGYILLEYLDGILLAKTFLLLTNNGTPEGDKLSEISGMKKFDHKYWAIDKLSTFH